jgi:hypothetical protein
MIYTDLTTALRRESDGAFIPKDPANGDYARALQEVADGVSTIQQPAPIDPTPARISAAWEAANALAESVIDHNSREQFIVWLIDPTVSAARKAAIADCMTWMAGIWQTYAATKAQIVAGNDAKFSFDTPCPHTFWEVAAL